MPESASLRGVIRNMLQSGDLSFSDFMEVALYHPNFGYYARSSSPVGKEGDYVTSPTLSPVFAFALGKLVHEFVSRSGDGVCTIVDIGCGDGRLIHSLYLQADENTRGRASFVGIDRSLARVPDERHASGIEFRTSLGELPTAGAHLLLINELFDALPFARLVRRGEHLQELWVTERNGELDWTEHEASANYEGYFAERGIELADGQFADVSLEWEALYGELADLTQRGLIVTFDYGYPEKQLFDKRARRYGTAASYSRQRVTRDLLADPGGHDLTAHINFTDLIRAGEARGLRTLFFDRQAKFLLPLGITEHELFAPAQDVRIESVAEAVDLRDRRDDARRLVLPDDLGHDIRVLVQSRAMPEVGWSFQRKLF